MVPTLYVPVIMAAAAAALLAVAAAAAASDDQDACQAAQQAFSECVPYVVGGEPDVTASCCTGLGDLREMAGDAVAQRSALCACVLSEVMEAGGGSMDAGRAAGLAASCGVPVGFIPTKPGFDCSAVS